MTLMRGERSRPIRIAQEEGNMIGFQERDITKSMDTSRAIEELETLLEDSGPSLSVTSEIVDMIARLRCLGGHETDDAFMQWR